jgi:hypothetical protein
MADRKGLGVLWFLLQQGFSLQLSSFCTAQREWIVTTMDVDIMVILHGYDMGRQKFVSMG